MTGEKNTQHIHEHALSTKKKLNIDNWLYIHYNRVKKWKGIKEQLPKDDVMKIIIVK